MKHTVAIAGVVLGLLCGSAAAADTTHPNVVLICVDDLKPVLGCYGDPIARSPNIDRLAARGVRFDRAYCNQAVCSPSRNALLTGLRPQTIGIYDLATHFRLAVPEAVTLPQYFKQHGYRTEALGKVFHIGHGNQDDVRSWSVPHFAGKGNVYALAENTPRAERQPTKPKKNRHKGAPYESADVDDSAYPDGRVADEAVRRIQAAAGTSEQPFFLAVGFVKPHLPFCAPKRYWDLYDSSEIRLAERREPPEGAPSYAPQFGGELRGYRGLPQSGAIPDDLQRILIHGYYAAMSYMDAQVGKVLAALDETGLAKNTIVVLWGDHGWHLGDHGMWCKHTNYEHGARIPVIVATPDMATAGKATSAPIESVDIYPTLCDIAGLSAPANLDGKSFAQTLKDLTAPTKEYVLHAYPRNERLGRAIRTERYRLVEWKVPGGLPDSAEIELYDYQADPLETKNLAGERPEIVHQLRVILNQQPEAKPQFKQKDGVTPAT